MKLLSALRITFSIPIVYNKVNYNNKIYVDGGLTDNLPIHIIKDDILHTLAFYITSDKENSIDIITQQYIETEITSSINKDNFDTKKIINYYVTEEKLEPNSILKILP